MSVLQFLISLVYGAQFSYSLLHMQRTHVAMAKCEFQVKAVEF